MHTMGLPIRVLTGCAGLLVTVALPAVGQVTESELLASPPLGPHMGRSRHAVKGFTSRDRFVATYYFFWYDHGRGEHFRNPDGTDALVDHPVDPRGISYRRPEWHRKELLDIMSAGIDVILPVYWGAPVDKAANFEGHNAGLGPMVAAVERLRAEGKRPPRIGMFYDTSSLSASGNIAGVHVDLSTPEGRAWFYVTIRDYFSAIPRKLWATVDGKPVVFLYGSGYARAGADDPKVFDYVRAHFAADFGVNPYLVAERSWTIPADCTYDWGAAFRPKALGVAAVGPGYDDHAVPGRTSPVIGREGGARYARAWEQMLAMDPRRRPRIAVIETWNELHEGTDICETREYGRKYIDLTRRYAHDWRAGKRRKSASAFAGAREVSVAFAPRAASRGVRIVSAGDGLTRRASAGGSACIETAPNPHSGLRFLYIDVDDGFYFEPSGPVDVVVDYFDEGGGTLTLDYDSSDSRALQTGAYKAAAPVTRGESRSWKTASFRLKDARFANRQNHFTDFRLSTGASTLKARRITVRRP